MATATTTPNYATELKGLRENLAGMLPEKMLADFDAAANNQEASFTNILKVKAGDTAPSFSLPDATGKTVSLGDLLKNGPVILTFYRGAWCPYCNLQLNGYQRILDQIKAKGAQLVAVSPQNADSSTAIADKNELTFPVLSDAGSTVAAKYTHVFRNDDTSVAAMAELGYDFDGFNVTDDRLLPVPAVFIIGQSGKITFASTTGGDYRNRVEPADVLAAL